MPATSRKLQIKETLRRSITIERQAIDEKNRTVALSFSSEAPVERWFGFEILGHKPGECNLTRLNSRAPLLVNHNTDDQVGVVESAEIKDGKGHAVVRFGESARAEEIFKDVKTGIRSLVSVGYRIHKMVTEKVEHGVETLRATSWEGLEISIASIPADTSVGVGRSDKAESYEVEVEELSTRAEQPPANRKKTMPAETDPQVIERERTEGAKLERNRIAEITAIADRVNTTEVRTYAKKAIEEQIPLENFRKEILEKHFNAKPVEAKSPDIGMSKRELGQYSLVRALNKLANKQPLDGLEKEASEEVAKRTRKDPQGFFVPHDIQSTSLASQRDLTPAEMLRVMMQVRALNATTASAGGYTIGTDVLTSSMVELLRNEMKVAGLGPRMLGGLLGNIAVPKHTGGATAYWLAESAEVTASQQTFGQLGLTPHRLAALTAFDKQLVMQTSLDVEAFVRQDLMAVLGLAKDLAAIAGTGTDGQPLGIINTTGIGSITYGAAPTWAKVVENETTLKTANAARGNIAFLTSPGVVGKWKTTEKASSTARYLLEENLANGYRVEDTNQVANNKTIFGNWSDLILADWDGMDVVVDPYTLAANNQIRIVMTVHTDNGIRNPVSFVVSTDSGAQ